MKRTPCNDVELHPYEEVDQAALHGVLRKARDVGMPFLSVMRMKPGHAETKAHQGNASTSFKKGVKHDYKQ